MRAEPPPPSHTPSVIAVDGGGTRCRLVLAEGEARVAVTAGPANVATDFEAALGEIRRGIDDLAAAAGRDAAAIAALPAYLGLAGASERAICARVEAALPFARVRVEEDRAPALAGALGPADGAIAHCGTGSFFGLQRGGVPRFVGGWGARLGDEASGFWVGRRALTLTLDAVDGLRPISPLAERFLARWGSPAGLVAFATGAGTDAIGALAPEVVAAAEARDAIGRAVLAEGAAHVAATLTAIGWGPGLAIALTGGLAPAYTPYLPETMQAALTAPRTTPIEGAVALARAFAREGAS